MATVAFFWQEMELNMAGVKGRSGAKPTTDDVLHLRGTWRKDRHNGRAPVEAVGKHGLTLIQLLHLCRGVWLIDSESHWGATDRESAVEAMRRAWRKPSVRAAVCALCAERHAAGHPRSVPWAHTEFGKGARTE